MADKKKGLGIPETKGQFQVRGVVVGTQKDNFYKETMTKTNKPFRSVNFGIQFDKDSTIYATTSGTEQEKVYFSKTEIDEVTKKKSTDVKPVAWKDRFAFKEDGYRLIGVNLGVQKIKDEKGKDINDKKTLVQYDACKEIEENITDGNCVFVKGNIEYSTYNEKHMTKFEPSQISLCKDIDFDSEDFKVMADFQQTIVFTGISPNEDKTKFIVSAKIVTYNTIEDAEFIIKDSSLANVFRKNLKPYQSIKVWGNINVEKKIEKLESNDCWGDSNNMERIDQPNLRELVITGADPSSIEKEIYSEQAIDEAIEKIKASKQASSDFGEGNTGSWGSVKGTNGNEEEDPW